PAATDCVALACETPANARQAETRTNRARSWGDFMATRKIVAAFTTFGKGLARKKSRRPNFCDLRLGLLYGKNRDAPWAIADFDPAKFLARFHVNNRHVV